MEWPDPFDRLVVLLFVVTTLSLPLAGYVFLVLDVRSYLRSLRRQLVRVMNGYSDLPEWATLENPPCLSALGLRLPCTEEELKAAYRRQVKRLHPDRGGDRRRFLRLQTHFEESLVVVRKFEARQGARRRKVRQS